MVKKSTKRSVGEYLDEIEEELIPAPAKIAANNFRWYIVSAVALALFAILLPKNPQNIYKQ